MTNAPRRNQAGGRAQERCAAADSNSSSTGSVFQRPAACRTVTCPRGRNSGRVEVAENSTMVGAPAAAIRCNGAGVVADRQRRAGAQRGDLRQVGAAGEVAGARRLALDGVRQARSRCSAADDHDVEAGVLHALRRARRSCSTGQRFSGRCAEPPGRQQHQRPVRAGRADRARLRRSWRGSSEMSGGAADSGLGRRVRPDAGVLQLLGLALQRVHRRRDARLRCGSEQPSAVPDQPGGAGRSAWKIRLVADVVLQVVDAVVVGAADAQDQRRPVAPGPWARRRPPPR